MIVDPKHFGYVLWAVAILMAIASARYLFAPEKTLKKASQVIGVKDPSAARVVCALGLVVSVGLMIAFWTIDIGKLFAQ